MDSLSYSFKGLAKKAAIRSRAWSDSEKRVSIGFLSARYYIYKIKVLIYISTLEILPSSEGFLFNYTYL